MPEYFSVSCNWHSVCYTTSYPKQRRLHFISTPSVGPHIAITTVLTDAFPPVAGFTLPNYRCLDEIWMGFLHDCRLSSSEYIFTSPLLQNVPLIGVT